MDTQLDDIKRLAEGEDHDQVWLHSKLRGFPFDCRRTGTTTTIGIPVEDLNKRFKVRLIVDEGRVGIAMGSSKKVGKNLVAMEMMQKLLIGVIRLKLKEKEQSIFLIQRLL